MEMIDILKLKTLQIMSELQIGIRPNMNKDGQLKIMPWVKLNGFDAQFTIESGVNGIINKDFENERYYLDPAILTSHSLKDILSKIDSTHENIKARSVIVHELTHLYQKGEFEELHGTKYIRRNESTEKDYISQTCEFDAHSVQAYYFLEECAYGTLIATKLLKPNIILYKETLIDNFRKANGQITVFKV